MARIVYPDADEGAARILGGGLAARLGRLGGFRLWLGQPRDEAEFLARIGEAEAVVLGWGMPDEVLAGAPRLRMVAFTGIGAGNHVNLALAASRGITVSNTPGYADRTVAEHTFALMLAVARRVPELDAAMRAGAWDQDREGVDLAGMTLGLVGLGGIGRRVAALGRAFGMEVVAWTPNPSPARAAEAGVAFLPLDEVFGRADVLSIHVALAPATAGLVGAAELARLRDGAILVNTARGEIVDEAALVAELASGRLRAGLDVFAGEPLAPDHPLRRMPNVVLTPHSAFNTPAAKRAIYELAVAAVEGWAAGRPINTVSA